MRLSLCTSLIVLAVGAALPAAAQESAIAREVQVQQENQAGPAVPRDPYTEAMMALKEKLVRQTKADGGKLTPEHQAAIQKELEAINARYRRTAKNP